jgi:amino acid transporter
LTSTPIEEITHSVRTSTLRHLIFGSPFSTTQTGAQRLPKILALPVFSSDALSSVAYGTQEILLQLTLAGTAGMILTVPISLAIVVVLALVTLSYQQTVYAYPSGGGSYIVAKENLSVSAGLLAAAALLIDYVLTVAVSIAAGAQQITSFVPALAPHPEALCLAAIAFMTFANLRGVKESGRVFAVPTYFFVAALLGMIGVGVVGPWIGYHPMSLGQTTPPPQRALSLFVILRAFAGGCSALTGVEAISNGVQAFRPPESRNAAQTLAVMALLLGAMFVGVSHLAQASQVVYAHGQDQESVLSLIARTVFHDNDALRAIVLFSTALILVLAANTAYADFPRLSAILARDGFAPRQLARLGDRLVYSNGIILLGVFAALLVIVFRGQTDRLIPLYAVGVFLSFTLSQTGMVRHWLRVRGPGWPVKAFANGAGALATTLVLLVVLLEKTTEGAWAVLIVIPALTWLFHQVQRYYTPLDQALTIEAYAPPAAPAHTVLVPVSRVNRGVMEALRYARTIAPDCRAVHIEIIPDDTPALRALWDQWGGGTPLVILKSPYRSLVEPLFAYIQQVQQERPAQLVTVVLPQFVGSHWWEYLLHHNTAHVLNLILTRLEGVVVTEVRYSVP